MNAVLRIHATTAGDPLKAYVERLVKLIPAEVVSLYVAGRALIQASFPQGGDAAQPYWIGWTLFCLVAVVIVRAWATSDAALRLKPQWGAVAIATVSFVVWVYSLGDVFRPWPVWSELAAGLLVLAWTFIAPWLVRPDPTPPEVEVAGAGVPPERFTERQAKEVVAACSQNAPLSEVVNVQHSTNALVGHLLASVGETIHKDHRIDVRLTGLTSAELAERGEGTYRALALWTRDRVLRQGTDLGSSQEHTR
jgi:hypothetical protein